MLLTGDFDNQLQALVNAVGAETVVRHILEGDSEAVFVGMRLSHDSNGNLSETDIETIRSL